MQNPNLERVAYELFNAYRTNKKAKADMIEKYRQELTLLEAEIKTKKSTLEKNITTLESYKTDYNRYINSVKQLFVDLCTNKQNSIAKTRVNEYERLAKELKAAEISLKSKENVSEPIRLKSQIARHSEDNGVLTGISNITTHLNTLLNLLLKASYLFGISLTICAFLIIKSGYATDGVLSKELFSYVVFAYIALVVVTLIVKRSNNKLIINAVISNDNKKRDRDKTKSLEIYNKAKSEYDKFKERYAKYIDDTKKTISLKGENIFLSESCYESLLKGAQEGIKSPANKSIFPTLCQFSLIKTPNSRMAMKESSQELNSSIDTTLNALKRQLADISATKDTKLEKLNLKYNDITISLNSEMAKKQQQFTAVSNSSIITSFNTKFASSDLNRLLNEARSNVFLEYIPIGRLIKSKDSIVPNYIKWQSREKGYKSNIWITYCEDNRQSALDITNSMMLRMLMAFSAGRINFSFFDVDFSGFQNQFLNLFDGVEERLYNHRVYSSSEEVRTKIAQLKTKLAETQKLCHNTTIVDHYCSSKHTGAQAIIKPYEVVVVYNIDQHSDIVSEIRPLIANGNDSGIYVIILQPDATKADRDHGGGYVLNLNDFNLINVNDSDSFVMDQDSFFTPISSEIDPLSSGSELVTEYRNNLKNILEATYESNKVTIDFSQYYNTPYSDPSAGISIPIGVTSADNTILNVDICGDTSAHTLILGETGSGKSVLFQDLITSCTLKYSPRDLTLYLIDLKSGGVGFNSYVQDYVPHVKSVLQNNTDMEVIRSCFVQIAEELERRGELMQEMGVPKIEEYNRVVEPSERLPRIIIAIDECQKLLRSEYGDLRDSIEEIIRMGRSYGVNLILATQTIDSALSALSANIANMFIMKNSDPNINAAIRRDSGIDGVSSKYGINSFLAGECLFIQRAKIVKFRAHNIEPNHRDILKAVLNKAAANVCGGDVERLKSTYKPFIYNSRLKCRIEEISDSTLQYAQRMGNSVVLGRDLLRSDETYTTVALANNSRNSNLLVIGDMSMSSDESKTANNRMRAIISSIISIRNYYKQNNQPYQISIINNYTYDDQCSRLLSIVGESDDSCVIIDDSDRDNQIKQLHERVERGKDDNAIDTYLFIIEGQMWYDYAEASSAVDHRKCMLDILSKGFITKVHTVVSVDNIESCEHMFMYRGAMTTGFAHTLLFRMKEADVKRLGIRTTLTTATLNINANQLRAIYFNRNNNKPTLLLPFELPEEAFMARV